MTEDIQETNVFKEYTGDIVELMGETLIIANPDDTIKAVNNSTLNLLGYNKDELIGKPVNMIITGGELFKAPGDAGVTEKSRINGIETIYRSKQGKEIPVVVSGTEARNSDGTIQGIIYVGADISDRRQMERELAGVKEKAVADSKIKDEFLANMSHEIRTPLNGIIGMTELIMDSTLDDTQLGLVHTLNIETTSLLNIINDILDFSKIESGMLELEDIPFDLCAAIDDIHESFQYKVYQKGLEFNCCMPADIPSLLIGDPTRLRQIFVNLINNALKFTNEGEILINVGIAEDIGEKVKLSFMIADTGIGIPADKQALIFEKFVQADSSTSKKYGGTGLGVAICKQFAELMGGELRLESEVGKGSTFEFTAVFAKQKEPEAVKTGESDVAGKKVLIVDDCRDDRLELKECLESFGCMIVKASDGNEALDILRETVSSGKYFDLILIDFNMPQKSSVDLVKKIKEIYLLKEIPSIILTNVGKVGDAKVCSDIGVDGYLTKPVRKDYLRRAIELVVTKARGVEDHISQQLVTRHTIAEEKKINDIRILLVEDYPTNQLMAMKNLQHAGYKVDLAETGTQAVAAYKKKHYGLVFMDLQLPEIDGFEATRRIRAHESEFTNPDDQIAARAVIIAMTAHATTEYRDKCLDGGMDDFITKPVRRKELLAMVEKWENKIASSRPSTVSEDTVTHSPKPDKIVSRQLPVSDGPAKPDDQTKQTGPIDFEMGIEEFEGDEDFFMEVVVGFLENVRNQTKKIKQAISDGNSERVRKEAHSIKGGAGNLTANNLSDIAAELEDIGESGNLKDGTEVFERLEQEFHRLETFIKNRHVV